MNGVRVRDVRTGDVKVALQQVRYEQKSYWRNPMAAVFTFLFPIVFLIVVGTSAGSSKVPGYHPALRPVHRGGHARPSA